MPAPVCGEAPAGEGPHFRTGGRFEQDHGPIVPVGDQRLAVGAERDGIGRAGPGDGVEMLAGCQVPDADCPVLPGRREPFAVRAGGHGPHLPGVALSGEQLLPGGGVVGPDNSFALVPRRMGDVRVQRLAVRAEVEAGPARAIAE